ncbi:DUF1799 domain-containing protein [Pseudodesulfovibrio karagichevae]|uniref:DUF1799 domain-containing protein n=1 Tax=Pseudodesulfovibrio karagichevae TaxID=3239305 RepID=A0ABV4K246_9BACT
MQPQGEHLVLDDHHLHLLVGERNKKLHEVWGWRTDPDRIDYCRACGGSGSECEGCENSHGPELWPENAGAWRLWRGMSTQWRSSGFGVIGLDYSVIRETAAMLLPPVDYTPRTFAKLRALEQAELERQRERMEEARRSTKPGAGT